MILDDETLALLGYASANPDVYDPEIPGRTFKRSSGVVDGRSLAHAGRRAKLKALYWARRARQAAA